MGESAINVAMEALRQLLQKEKREDSTILAVKHCQVTNESVIMSSLDMCHVM